MIFAPGMVSASSSAPTANVPQQILELANKLKLRHGDILIARERNGYHLYFASPACLTTMGVAELSKKHLALNAEKYLGLGSFRRLVGTYNAKTLARLPTRPVESSGISSKPRRSSS